MKVAISVPDKLYKQADILANERKISRSALYAAAIEKYVKACEDEAIDARIQEAYADGGPEPDPVVEQLKAHAVRLYDKW